MERRTKEIKNTRKKSSQLTLFEDCRIEFLIDGARDGKF